MLLCFAENYIKYLARGIIGADLHKLLGDYRLTGAMIRYIFDFHLVEEEFIIQSTFLNLVGMFHITLVHNTLVHLNQNQ